MHADKQGDYDVKVSGVEISPYPIVKGKPATFSISASAGNLLVSYGSFVCSTLFFVGLMCICWSLFILTCNYIRESFTWHASMFNHYFLLGNIDVKWKK